MNKPFTLLLIFFLSAGLAFGQGNTHIQRSKEIKKIDDKTYIIHTVEKYQSLYMIAKTYGVEVEDIIRENPEVKEGIHPKQQLKILISTSPEKQEIKKETPKTQTPVVKKESPPEEEKILPCGQDPRGKKSIYTVALMLPLYLDNISTIDSESVKEIENIKPFEFLPFYEGFRMAVDSMVAKGFSVKLLVYDIHEDTTQTRKILKSEEFKNVDLIIGLLFTRNFRIVASYALKNKIPIVNTVSERDEIIRHNPEVIKVKAGMKSQSGFLEDLIRKNFPDQNVIVIRDPGYKNKESVDNFLALCRKANISTHLTDGYANAAPMLVKEKENVLVVFSENKVKVIDWVTKFNIKRKEYSMTLIGIPRWDKMEDGIETDYMLNLKAHIIAPSFIDYDNDSTKQFVRNYQIAFKTDPDPLAFQGYDVATYFLTALSKYGRNFKRCLPEFTMKGLRSDYIFYQPATGDGLENISWRIYSYDNYRLVRVNP
ncbi:MAG: ABC transporter substrate-binding protein [Bacteroidota bacterium]|nr:ABC transporter substrate-binding protein [Bacteroidota bacterium]